MKAIMISIKPKYVADILNGKKTIEIRKTAPNCDLPIDVYIYCTKDKPRAIMTDKGCVVANTLEVGGNSQYKSGYSCSGGVVAKFTLNKVEVIKLPYTKFGCNERVGCEEERTLQTQTMNEETLLEKSCLKEIEIYGYLNFKHSPDNVGYAWHISNLEIFDKPKELNEFYKVGFDKALKESLKEPPYPLSPHCIQKEYELTKAPQSYMFIEAN